MKALQSLALLVIIAAVIVISWQVILTAQTIRKEASQTRAQAEKSACVVRAWTRNTSASDIQLPAVTVDALIGKISADTRTSKAKAQTINHLRKQAIDAC